jgi:hypothetical protein
MTARHALDEANRAETGERLRRYESRCPPRGVPLRVPIGTRRDVAASPPGGLFGAAISGMSDPVT